MIAPKPFLAICKKCGRTRFITPKSDVINPSEISPSCDKCGGSMIKKSQDEMLGDALDTLKDMGKGVLGELFGGKKF